MDFSELDEDAEADDDLDLDDGQLIINKILIIIINE